MLFALGDWSCEDIPFLCVLVVPVNIGLFSGTLHAQPVAPYLKNTNYITQLGMYDLFRSTHADVVMAGNSLTDNANWNEILNRSNIASRGISNDITSGYLHRPKYVFKLTPTLCSSKAVPTICTQMILPRTS